MSMPGGAVTLGRHIRIKEFLRSCDQQPGGDANWLTIWPSGHYNDRIRAIALNMTEALFEDAEKSGRTSLYQVAADIYDSWGDKDLPDVDLRGIVYSGGNFLASASRSFKLWGAVATHSGSAILDGVHKGPLTPVNWAIDS